MRFISRPLTMSGATDASIVLASTTMRRPSRRFTRFRSNRAASPSTASDSGPWTATPTRSCRLRFMRAPPRRRLRRYARYRVLSDAMTWIEHYRRRVIGMIRLGYYVVVRGERRGSDCYCRAPRLASRGRVPPRVGWWAAAEAVRRRSARGRRAIERSGRAPLFTSS